MNDITKNEQGMTPTGGLAYIPVSKLYPHPDNPRKDLGDLTELAESIKANGVLQNLTVVPNMVVGEISGDVWQRGYKVIIGHRRLAAAKLAGLKELPCVVVEMTEREQMSTMLTENMQRSDLTVYEQAQGFQMMLDMAKMNLGGKGMTGRKQVYPIYDWTTNDVWLYLRNEGVEIPQIYLYLWQSGTSRNQLRVSQFFSVDTARSLVQMNEYYPDLMERVIRREPNAYLATLYWDSEMFGRRSRTRRQTEGTAITKDYKALLTEMFSDMPRYFNTDHKMKVAKTYRGLFLKIGVIATPKDYQQMYEALQKGDPKLRSFRAL